MESLERQMAELREQKPAESQLDDQHSQLLPSGTRALADIGGVRHRSDVSLTF